ncbi:MAG: thiol-disulfide isomerase [Flavobacteriaceae bacterium]|nr:thiol-disulfide isomerase [Flavobacteriaceae bacterium]|tara:strand:+ start:327 stop:755 length:429 start_codon:yes stop_codon:yes gene_type:complete
MKKISFIFILLLGSLSYSQDWQTSYDRSLIKAKNENKKIILVFQGSDWCGPCIKLSQEIWSSDYFINYSNKKFVMLQADFPRKKKNFLSDEQQKSNNLLAEKYNPNGYFPFVVIIDKNENLLGEMGYKKTTPENFIKIIESF